ncbi:phospholipid scramblase 1-like isoform X1 [Liolophura sinensis]|uniref:phospholipid scramblase 1-like isoform X1 n=1 Tax=Liolophura sinensis TaxID=3198878 RepID=UPI0031593CB5
MNSPILTQPRPPSYTEVVVRDGHPVPQSLTYLDSLSEVKVLQKLDEYEALYLKTLFERRNSYYIADENERVFFFAKEVTEPLSRLCCNSRALEIHIVDDYGVTLMILRRPLRCTSSCWWCCCLQDVEIESPMGIVRSYVREKWTPWWSAMDVVHPEGEVLYNIRGLCCTCRLRCHNSLQVFEAKSKVKVASYHKYCKSCTDFVGGLNDFSIKFHEEITAEDKLLLLGAGFIVDLVYLEYRSY